MVSFQQQSTYATREPLLIVDGDLPPGTYRFQLVVEDALGNRSLPDEREVTVLRPGVVVPRPPVLPPRPGRPVVGDPPPPPPLPDRPPRTRRSSPRSTRRSPEGGNG